jgi:hypothetical protein
MDTQLTLIETKPADWRLDDRTKEVGRLGLTQAREALRVAREATRGGADERHAA